MQLIRLITLFIALVCAWPTAAWAQNPDIQNCDEIKNEDTRFQADLCTAHLGCRLVMGVHRVCTKIKSFLTNLGNVIGEGRSTLFGLGRSKEVDSNQVLEAALPDATRQSTQTTPGWRSTTGKVDEEVAKADKNTLEGRAANGKSWVYVGGTTGNAPNGWGTKFYQDGTIERGQFSNGDRQGLGDTVQIDSGTRQTGTYSNGMLQGSGFERNARGDVYRGDFYKGQPNGYGTLQRADGSRVEGGWADGKPAGVSTSYRPDGSVIASGVNGGAQPVNDMYAAAVQAGQREAQLIQEHKLRAEESERRRRELAAAEERTFRDSLATLNPGQMMVKADELNRSGKKTESRQVLQALIMRFPDHALAATAAQQLMQISAIANAATAAGSGNPSAGAAAAVVPTDASCKARLEQFARSKEPSKPPESQLIPKLQWLMSLTQESIKILKNLALCPDNQATRSGIQVYQQAFNQAQQTCDSISASPCSPAR